MNAKEYTALEKKLLKDWNALPNIEVQDEIKRADMKFVINEKLNKAWVLLTPEDRKKIIKKEVGYA